MIDVAIRSMLHERGKLAGSITGVAFAAAVLLAKVGLPPSPHEKRRLPLGETPPRDGRRDHGADRPPGG